MCSTSRTCSRALTGTAQRPAVQQANINSAADFNYTPYIVAAFFFVVLTIPLARFTDWLTERERSRRQTGGLV